MDIVLSQTRLVALRAFERVIQLILGEGELYDCTIKGLPWVNYPNGSSLTGTQLKGNFLFNGEEDYAQEVCGRILTRTYFREGDLNISELELDATHEVQVNGTKYHVWFQSSKAFQVVELDAQGKEVRVCARSAEYMEAQQLPLGAKVFE